MREVLSTELQLTIRNLYLFDGYGPQKIADTLCLETRDVSAIITREGLAKKRKEARALAVQENDKARAQLALQTADALASKAEQHAIKALDKTGLALDADNARDAKDYSTTARNLVALARAVVAPPSAESVGSVNLFFVQVAPAASEYASCLD